MRSKIALIIIFLSVFLIPAMGTTCVPGNSSCEEYNEGDYQKLNDNALPSDSNGFRDILIGQGYSPDVGGFIDMFNDYAMLYVVVGMALFVGKLMEE